MLNQRLETRNQKRKTDNLEILLQSLIQDLRYGARMLLKKPGFTIVAILTLAFGIGVNTALFTGFNIFLRPKPIKDPYSIVRLDYQSGRSGRVFAHPDYVYLRDNTQAFSEVIANFEEKFLLGDRTPGVEPEEIVGNFISENYMSTLGASPGLGRFFTSEENQIGRAEAVVVLTDHFWRRRFGGDPEIIGRSIHLNGTPFTVVGVTSPAFVGLRYDMPDIWLPIAIRPAVATVYFENVVPAERDWLDGQKFRWVTLHARIATGKTVSDARAESAVLLSQLARANPAIDARDSINVESISDIGSDNEVWILMAMVLGASGLVLLIACSNIANMLLARAASRQKEVGVRLCLGASRGRLIRQLLTESFMLAALGGGAGVLLSWWSLDLFLMAALTRYDGGNSARLSVNLSPDLRVLGFSLLLTLISGIAFGLAPALRATRLDLISVIKDEGASLSGRIARSKLRNALVVAQVSLCLILLIPAGLLVRGVEHVLAADPGYEPKKLLAVSYSLELSGYNAQRARLFHDQLTERMSALPGVKAVSPNRVFGSLVTIKLSDAQGGGERQFDRTPLQSVTADYLETIGTPILQGRGFTVAEANSKAPVIIVSETTARNLWPGETPLGKTFRVEVRFRDGTSEAIFPTAEVIGVAGDNQAYRVGQNPPLLLYAPEMPSEWLDMSLMVRTEQDPASLKEIARKEAYALEPVLRLWVNTIEELIENDKGVQVSRAASELAAGLGGLALVLAAIGVYGVMSWSVSQRTREIGIRMALGAETHDVVRLVLRQAMRLVLLGALIGVAGSFAVTQVIKSMLFGLSATDPVSYAVMTSLIVVVALLASYLPVRRATRVDPMVALRYE
jgi:putative ABC transport system permease protein